MRLQPSKSTMPFNIQAQAARQQPKQARTTHASSSPAAQPRMTYACSSPGWMVQNLINYSSIGGTARLKPGATGCPTLSPHLPPWALKLMLPPAQECQIAHLGILATPADSRWHQGLAADTRGGQRPPKYDSNSFQNWHQATK